MVLSLSFFVFIRWESQIPLSFIFFTLLFFFFQPEKPFPHRVVFVVGHVYFLTPIYKSTSDIVFFVCTSRRLHASSIRVKERERELLSLLRTEQAWEYRAFALSNALTHTTHIYSHVSACSKGTLHTHTCARLLPLLLLLLPTLLFTRLL